MACKWFHKWEKVEQMSSPLNIYSQCKKCGARRVEHPFTITGYQPIDISWIKGGA